VLKPAYLESDAALEALVEIAEHYLEVDAESPEMVWVVDQATYYFASREKNATFIYPVSDPRHGRERYRWEKQPDGSEFGWLVDGV
jgi:hypothetical protein